MRALVLVLAAAGALLVSGCFSEILPAGPETKLRFICSVLDPNEAERVVIDSWVGEGVIVDAASALQALQSELSRLGLRNGDVVVRAHEGPPAPKGGWTDEALLEWLEQRPGSLADEVHLHVFWVASLGGPSVHQPWHGLVLVAQDSVQTGAEGLGRGEADVARAVLLHGVGHALGVVNLAIPVQDPDLQEREGPPGHDPDPTSVLHAGWDQAATMTWAANATYDSWSPALHADWAAAVQSGGVCAA